MSSNFKDWYNWNFGKGCDWYISKYIFLVLLGAGSFFFISKISTIDHTDDQLKLLHGTTVGTITSINPVKTETQSKFGYNTSTIGYNVSFSYNIDSVNYTGKEYFISNSKNDLLIRKMYDYFGQKCFLVKYSYYDPNKSMVVGKIKI